MSMVEFNNKFKRIAKKLYEVGFTEYHQAGSPNKFHEMNIVCVSKELNKQYWVGKSFGKFHFASCDLNDLKQKHSCKRIDFKNQTELINKLMEIKNEIENFKQTT